MRFVLPQIWEIGLFFYTTSYKESLKIESMKMLLIAIADFFVTLVGLLITGIIPCLNEDRKVILFYYFRCNRDKNFFAKRDTTH